MSEKKYDKEKTVVKRRCLKCHCTFYTPENYRRCDACRAEDRGIPDLIPVSTV